MKYTLQLQLISSRNGDVPMPLFFEAYIIISFVTNTRIDVPLLVFELNTFIVYVTVAKNEPYEF